MKKRLIYLAALAVSMGMISACSDKADDNWKNIPDNIITAESGDATLTVNGVPDKIGNTKLIASSKEKGTLTLTNVIPGYTTVEVPVTLKKISKEEYEFSGSENLASAPSIISLFSVDKTPIYTVSITGRISSDSKITVDATTAVSEAAQGGIAGTWKLQDNIVTKDGAVASSPIMLKWTSKDAQVNAKLAVLSNMAGLFGSMALFNVLQSVTFNADGNITASYYDGDFAMGGMDETSGKLTATHTDWTESPKANLAFWYTAGEYLFIVPNVEALSDDDDASDPDAGSLDIKKVIEEISQLKEYGVDVTALVSELTKIMKQGFALKFTAEGDGLKIYADKSVCGNVISAIIPAAAMLDKVLPQLIEENPELAQYVTMIQGMFGIEKFADLENIWKATDEFCITMNLAK